MSYGRFHGQKEPFFCFPVRNAHRIEQICYLSMLVSDGTTSWSVSVVETAPGVNREPMAQFLDSFQPIG